MFGVEYGGGGFSCDIIVNFGFVLCVLGCGVECGEILV